MRTLIATAEVAGWSTEAIGLIAVPILLFLAGGLVSWFMSRDAAEKAAAKAASDAAFAAGRAQATEEQQARAVRGIHKRMDQFEKAINGLMVEFHVMRAALADRKLVPQPTTPPILMRPRDDDEEAET